MQEGTYLTIPTAIDRCDVLSSSYAYSIADSSSSQYDVAYIVIIAATSDLAGMMLNGMQISAASFTAVGDSLHSAAKLPIQSGKGVVENDNGKRFTGYWFAFDTVSSEGAATSLSVNNDGTVQAPCALSGSTAEITTIHTTDVESTTDPTTSSDNAMASRTGKSGFIIDLSQLVHVVSCAFMALLITG